MILTAGPNQGYVSLTFIKQIAEVRCEGSDGVRARRFRGGSGDFAGLGAKVAIHGGTTALLQMLQQQRLNRFWMAAASSSSSFCANSPSAKYI